MQIDDLVAQLQADMAASTTVLERAARNLAGALPAPARVLKELEKEAQRRSVTCSMYK